MDLERLPGQYDLIFDVGGNIGEWAEQAHRRWPDAQIWSFEPVPALASENLRRARGRWRVIGGAVGWRAERLQMNVCLNQHSASTVMEPGGTRARIGIVDSWEPIEVDALPLDYYLDCAEREHRFAQLLVKIDVEGYEGAVMAGGRRTLQQALGVVVEVQNDPDVFVDALCPEVVDEEMRRKGLRFHGLVGALMHDGRVLQYDAVYRR